MRKAIILIGPSGSGKSTVASNLGCRVVSADSYMVCDDGTYKFNPKKLTKAHRSCMREYIEFCVENKKEFELSIVVDNTNTTLVELSPYISVAMAMSMDVEILCISPPNGDLREWQEMLSRRNVHGVPMKTIAEQVINIRNTINNWPKFWPAIKMFYRPEIKI